MVEQRDVYAAGFRRARLDAARRLYRDDFLNIGPAAIAIGISKSQLEQIEQAKRRPSFETLLAMAQAYNVLPGDLLPTSTPKGAEVDRVLGSLMALPPTPRGVLMTQFEGMARAVAASIASVQVQNEAIRVVEERTSEDIRSNVRRNLEDDDTPPIYGLPEGDEVPPREEANAQPGRHRPHPTKKGHHTP